MTVRSIGTLLVITLFISCGTKSSDESVIISDTVKITDQGETKAVAPDSAKGGEDLNYSDCIRGQAAPVVKKSVYPNAVFKLYPDNHTGIETMDLKGGDKLTIKNWGCEYYVLTFRFETGRFQADTTNTVYWLGKAALLMKEIQAGIDAPLNLQDGIEAVSIQLASMDSGSYGLGEEIVFKDDMIRDFVTLDRIQRINEQRFAVEISFATGPL